MLKAGRSKAGWLQMTRVLRGKDTPRFNPFSLEFSSARARLSPAGSQCGGCAGRRALRSSSSYSSSSSPGGAALRGRTLRAPRTSSPHPLCDVMSLLSQRPLDVTVSSPRRAFLWLGNQGIAVLKDKCKKRGEKKASASELPPDSCLKHPVLKE